MEALATALAITCGTALICMFIGWWTAERRADRAERQLTRVENELERLQSAARHILRDALNSPSAEVRRNAREIQQFAGLPRHRPRKRGRITSVDQLINDVLGGR